MLKQNKQQHTQILFHTLSTIFITSLIITNLIGAKCFTILNNPISSSIIVYPITFIVTDIISEIYGEQKATLLIKTGFIVSIIVTIIIIITSNLPTSKHSPITNKTFKEMFSILPGNVLGSMIAYLLAQYIDIKIFDLLRKLTKGKHLWLRNNASTLCSQLIDTTSVVIISLVIWPTINTNSPITPLTPTTATKIILSQYIFKAIIALIDTPFVYIAINLAKKLIKQ